MKRILSLELFLALLITACAPSPSPRGTDAPPPTPVITTASSSTLLPPTATATVIPTLQPRLTLQPSGPDTENFAPGLNPLTGLPVQDPALLKLPAVLVSISNMPVTTRPQAGTGFAPWIFELFIGTGTTRFMGVFYGDPPRRIPNITGDCPVNADIFQPGENGWIGNRVWLDENADGLQNAWEVGVGGICVSLVDANGEEIASTSTDSNGYYGFTWSAKSPDFAVPKSGDFGLQFKLPSAYSFTTPNVGNDDEDSDVDPATGRTTLFHNGETEAGQGPEPVEGRSPELVEGWDAGLVLNPSLVATPSPHPNDIAPERTYIGPIRSGRLTYEDFYRMFPFSCLVFASAAGDILEQLDICEIIYGENPEVSPNTALLDVSRLPELAQRNQVEGQPVNYSGHLFDPQPPAAGQPATSLWTYYHAYTQTAWQYNPLSGAYLRFTDEADGQGRFHADTERLTGRQLAFENVIIVLADYQIYRHLQYDVDLGYGLEGWAYLFRDGQMYKIRWSTANREWERQTGLLRPIHFIGNDKQPFPLKPGRTWISLMTLNSAVKELEAGKWRALFAMPNDPAPTP